jgi:hypothetical protein
LCDGCCGCLDCSWIFPELFESFLFWLRIFIHDDHLDALNWSLTYLAHEMDLLIDYDLVLFRICSWVNKHALCWVWGSVLDFWSSFDPRPWPSGLLLTIWVVISGSSVHLHDWCCSFIWAWLLVVVG